ncbi:MAG: TIGR01459 family HAD-type hydrolase [Rhodobacteraceae bacterium]|nr:TIGR01459 family HAD-type hydrolase [Paracoccaceae bacterium]
MTVRISGIAEIIDQIEGLLIDQYGVLHDGRAPFPGALACLLEVRARGLPIVAVTNSGKRADFNSKRLENIGFPADLFRGLVSSGELARERLAGMLASGALSDGDAVAVISRGGDGGMLAELPLCAVALGEPAALVLIAGAEPERVGLDQYREQLAPYAAQGAVGICSNPDLIMYVEGGTAFGAGAIAKVYQQLGGEVELVGKPGAAMFEAGLERLGARPERVLMIGDSLEHDIAGAAGCGCRTLWISGGVQGAVEGGEVAPDFVCERLVWS